MPDITPEIKCPKCGDALLEGKPYCPNCGLSVGPQVERTAIDSYIQARIAQELSTRLKDQGSLVREIGDRAEDVVWGRLKRYGFIVTILIVILGFLGVKSIDDAERKIVDSAGQRVEPLIQKVEGRAKAVEGDISKTAERLATINGLVDKETKEISGLGLNTATALAKVSEYEKRIRDYEGRISTSGGDALAQVVSLKASFAKAQSEVGALQDAMRQQQKSLNDTGLLVRDLQGQVVDLGNREVRAKAFVGTNNISALISFGLTGCRPPDSDAKVGYCAEGSPPILFQVMPNGEKRPVSSVSSIGFQDISASAKPTCRAETRAVFYVEKGTGRTADKPFLCVKKSDNAYEWIQIGIVP